MPIESVIHSLNSARSETMKLLAGINQALAALEGGSHKSITIPASKRTHTQGARVISIEAREKMAMAQKARWAKFKKAKAA